MSAIFTDLQNPDSVLNGRQLTTVHQLRELLASQRDRLPFFAELEDPRGHKLLIGIGAEHGCVQHSTSTGEPPYLMARDQESTEMVGEMDFLINGTETPVPLRYVLLNEIVDEIASYFVETGLRSQRVSWEAI